MTNQTINHDLERLRAEVEQVATNDTEAKERINKLISAVEQRIDESVEDLEDDETLLENIRETISQFETEHPRATAILNDIMVTLSNMGI